MVTALRLQLLCGQLDRQEIAATEFMEKCTRLITESIGCSRAGIWLFEGGAEDRRLRCLSLYDASRDCMDPMPDENKRQIGAYFDALEQTGYVVASDARAHPATSGLFAQNLDAHGVQSLMAAAFSVNGQLFGAFTCSQTHWTVEWTPHQLAMLMRIGARASLALAGATAVASPTLPAPL